MEKKCKYELWYNQNVKPIFNVANFNEYLEQLEQLVPCANCGNKVKFGLMYDVWCSNECFFHHKYICNKCKEILEN